MKTETAMSKAAQDNYRNLAASMAKHLSRRGHVPFYAATAAEKLEARFEEAQCDVFLVSSNAITKDGVLVNIDGSGNRVAAMCWSRGDRIYVVGMNKVCPDVESALARVRDRVAPPNAQRLSSSGRSVAPDSICRAVLIMEQAPTMPDGKKSYVVLVGEELGY